ncbi:MAG: aldehyde dehydrogenase [Planctomycetia bacterium]|nr:aldehyde dehydrogenase [Planctomycetia bacterium]
MGKVAIHGFGRIGRSLLKAALRDKLFVPSSVSDIKDAATLGALFAADSNYGLWPGVKATESSFTINDHPIAYHKIDVKQPDLPDWGKLGVDVVVDCTGRATRREGAEAHLKKGAKRVLISAPSKTREDCDILILRGINDQEYDPARHKIVSMASCTTNALAPVCKVLLDTCGIKHGLFSTVHAYTNTQSLTDQPMADRRDSWAATENLIPASSGAARALAWIWPGLKITGKAYRVPVRTGSIAEVNVVVERPTDAKTLNEAFRAAANPKNKGPLVGVMDVLEEEWASSRIVGDPHSSIIDLPLTTVQEGTLVSVAAWYDNEMGYATRLAEMAGKLAK